MGVGGNSQRRHLTLLHTSDLHLGSDTYSAEALQGFGAVLKLAVSKGVDALIIAGDLFDSGRVPQWMVTHVWQSLSNLGIPVVVLPGNHDIPLTTEPFVSMPVSDGVHVLRDPAGELKTFDSVGLSVWGRPVYDHEPSFRPLEGLQPRPDHGWYVAIAHGVVTDGPDFAYRASPIALQELAQADCDYVALGHVHAFRDVTQGSALAFYSGAPSGAWLRTAALVILDPANGVRVEPVHIT